MSLTIELPPDVVEAKKNDIENGLGSRPNAKRRATLTPRRKRAAWKRLAERGVRFTLVYLSDHGEWDSQRSGCGRG